MDKQQIRKKLLKKRSELEHAFVQEAEGLVLKNTQALLEFFQGQGVALYSSVRNEVETGGLFKYLKDKASTVVFPRNYNVPHKELKFYVVNDLSELNPGPFGILEPKGDPTKEVPLTDIHVYFIPGVAFDVAGHRVGYGSGYYDRALSCGGRKALKIGLAYDFQVLEEVPHQTHDVAMDMIVTESRPIECLKFGLKENKNDNT